MSFFYRLSENSVRLFLLSQVLLLLAFTFRDFPIFIFFAFAPLFALTNNPSGLRDSYLPFGVAIITALIFYFIMRESMQYSSVLSWILYFMMLAIVFTCYVIISRWTPASVNKLALIVFILGAEYLFLKLAQNIHPVFLADLLQRKPNWTSWNVYTGYAGATLWILVTNLLVYGTFFRNIKVNWPMGAIALVVLILPIVLSLSIDANPITKLDVIALYSEGSSVNQRYSAQGELISRTGAWVSTLIIIFTVIKGLTKKVSR